VIEVPVSEEPLYIPKRLVGRVQVALLREPEEGLGSRGADDVDMLLGLRQRPDEFLVIHFYGI
jgi:hypothetical protein